MLVPIPPTGVAVFSTATRQSPERKGYTTAGFSSADGSVRIAGGGAAEAGTIVWGGTGKVSGRIVDCGTGTGPCPEARGNLCMVQYDPAMRKSGSSSGSGSGGSKPPQRAGATKSADGAVTGQQQQPPPADVDIPTRFYCDAVEFCMGQGAKAVLLGPPTVASGFYGTVPTDPMLLRQVSDMVALIPLRASLDCSEDGCQCWKRINRTTRPPVVGFTLQKFAALKDAVGKATREKRSFNGTMEAQVGSSVCPLMQFY